ncbi:methyltransferase domain-containing protein [Methylobacterium terricola]|uniref:Methyltransferase domain-containing protein n=1 Tax=Methylobacterium terricola TaxID=2583531 RepID=A0A5C4L810_9HYPH|nr:class I SAM-dependent methyltransferase [Methylobacterium terricola]TNC07794.1 methyltransferase domain-containing protein [Methylobacterium terricola]
MTGFSPDWLALREPADHAARDPGLVATLARVLGSRIADVPVRVVDLGCGTGSNLRALAPHLGPAQDWTLVDHDPALLAAARERLAAWAEGAREDGDALVLQHGGVRIAVRLRALDLAADPAAALGERPDLVTAAALFDLVSEEWITVVAEAVAGRGAAFYTALTYDGQESWHPPDPDDGAIHAAFLHHQAGDKGFGPAAGPGATAVLDAAFRRHGYTVETAASPWRLGPDEAALVHELAEGTARAAAETGPVSKAEAAAWGACRQAPGTAAVIGHRDLLAVPAGSAGATESRSEIETSDPHPESGRVTALA